MFNRFAKLTLLLVLTFILITIASAKESNAKSAMVSVQQSCEITVAPTSAYTTVKDYCYQPLTQDDVENGKKEVLLATYAGVKVNVEDSLNMRTHPEDGDIIRIMRDGTVCRLLDIEGDWYKVSLGKHVGYVKAEYTTLVPTAEFEENVASMGAIDDLVNEALTWLGTRYRAGGCSKSGTDCSGFMMSLFGEYGVDLPHSASDQYNMATYVSTENRTVGDLVFFSSSAIPHGVAHVGLYLGNGEFIHASSSYGVIISSVWESYYAYHYIGAGRISLGN